MIKKIYTKTEKISFTTLYSKLLLLGMVLLFSYSAFGQAGHYGTVTANNARASAPTLTLTAPNTCSDVGNLKSGKIAVRNLSAATADNFINSQTCFTIANTNLNRNVWVKVTIPAGSGISGIYFYSSTSGVTPQPTASTNLRTAFIQVYNSAATACTPALNCGSTWGNAITDISLTAPHIRSVGTERVDVVAGNTYLIEISTTTFSTDPNYNFDVFVVPLGTVPSNTNCANAIPFSTTNQIACNLGAKAACNTNIPSCAFTLENSVFYSFVKPGTGVFQVTISNVQCEGGGNDLQTAIYRATTANCNTNLNTTGNQIANRCFIGSYTYTIDNSDPPGTEYIIWFDGNAGAACTWGVEVTCPSISSQPTDRAICSSGSGFLSVTASYGTYQWQYNNSGTWQNVTNNNPAGVNYANATTNTLTIAPTLDVTPLGTYQYRVLVGTGSCQVTSNTATVTVVGANAPTGAQCSGTTLNFSAFPATGATYSWSVTPPSGTSAAPTSGTAANFSFVPTNVTGTNQNFSVTSAITVGTLTCNRTFTPTVYSAAVPPVLTGSGSSQNTCVNSTATVSGIGSNNPAATYSWSENGAGSITAGGTTLTPTYTPAAADAGTTVTLTLTATVTDGVNSCPNGVSTATYDIIVDPLPTASAGGTAPGCSANGTVTVSGASASNGTIAWTENGAGSITTAGATTTTPTYTAAAGDAGKAVTLFMTVTSNNACAPQTASATYTINVAPLPVAPTLSGQTNP